MKKFYWLLLFIPLFIGCANKVDTVMNKLENKTDEYTIKTPNIKINVYFNFTLDFKLNILIS